MSEPTTSTMTFTARVHHEDGSYWAEVVELEGCFASGETLDELRDALSEAISLYLTDEPDTGRVTTPLDAEHAVDRGADVDEMKLAVPC